MVFERTTNGLTEIDSDPRKPVKKRSSLQDKLSHHVDLGTILPNFNPLIFGNEDGRSGSRGLRDLVKPHLDSFNNMLETQLPRALKYFRPLEFEYSPDERFKISIQNIEIYRPRNTEQNAMMGECKIYPHECRVTRTTYKSALMLKLSVSVNDQNVLTIRKHLADVPVMVGSKICNLHGMSRKELTERKEETDEGGGYFIINGSEKIIRLLLALRRNYPMAIKRSGWRNRGPGYSDIGLTIRSVRDDGIFMNNMIHYVQNGTCTICIPVNRQLFYIPFIVVIKALSSECFLAIYSDLMNCNMPLSDNYARCLKLMLRQLLEVKITSQAAALEYIGLRFRNKLPEVPSWLTDEQIGSRMIEDYVFIHLDSFEKKYRFAVLCTQKLFALAENKCKADPVDTTMMHEIILPGQVYIAVLLERIRTWLNSQQSTLLKLRKTKSVCLPSVASLVREVFASASSLVNRGLDHFFSTGNVSNRCQISSVQSSGWIIMAERINIMRYIAHFRSLHRGTVVLNTRSSGVRRLCPESFGFVCPVNTPDGTLCGILTHLSAHCGVSESAVNDNDFVKLLVLHGMIPEEEFRSDRRPTNYYEVLLDGCVVGRVVQPGVTNIILFLREQKSVGHPSVPKHLEIAFVERCEDGETSLYPGIYMFTMESRLIRPVFNIATRTVEYISTMEQVYLGIAPNDKSFVSGFTTHYELVPYSFISFVASMTPFSEFNQSPRNMYQCQMGKQAVGVPCHFVKGRYDNKLYQLVAGQSPLVKTRSYQFYEMDKYPSGINAVVAVLSYTGYDMEDAMIINKMAAERGFGKTIIYTSEILDIADSRSSKQTNYFERLPSDTRLAQFVGLDGLPIVGARYCASDPFYSYVVGDTGEVVIGRYQKDESGTVVQVSLVAPDPGTGSNCTKACVLIEKCRDPIIGDKFSSRHGQKGVCSKLYPSIDLPFNEQGITPDIIFNPHGFPSRMTIGMMLEFLTGKAAAILGRAVDATPFQFDSDDTLEQSAIEYYGNVLRQCGFSHHGTEIMYSGTTGQPMEASIFMGMVFYQRLRHMVSDKFQVRRVGCYDAVTRQPIKGRKRGGGIRIGEMERDAILAHGCSLTLTDRLMTCSDSCTINICRKCGIIGTIRADRGALTCVQCNQTHNVSKISIPHILTYLIAELSALNIATVLHLQPACELK